MTTLKRTNSFECIQEKADPASLPSQSKSLPNLKALLLKQYYTHIRSPKGPLFILFAPIFVCFVLFLLQLLLDYRLQRGWPHPETNSLGYLPKCQPENSHTDCVSLGYALYGNGGANTPLDPWVNHTLHYIADHTGLKMDEDIKEIWRGNNISTLNDYLIQKQNQTQIGLIFCNGLVKFNGYFVNCSNPLDLLENGQQMAFYLLMYNLSMVSVEYQFNELIPNLPVYPLAASLKMLVDSGIADYFDIDQQQNSEEFAQDNQLYPTMNESTNLTHSKSHKINALYQSYPEPIARYMKNVTVVSTAGSIVFPISTMIVFIFMITEITGEKDKKLRQQLNLAGIGHLEYYISWIVVAIFYSLANAVGMLIGGFGFNFDIFYGTDLSIMFLLFFLYCLSLCFVAITAYTLIQTKHTAYTIAYGFLVCALAIQFQISNSGILPYIYDYTNTFWEFAIVDTMNVYPPFPFAKVWDKIQSAAGTSFDYPTYSWVEGPGCNWDTMFDVYKGRNRYFDWFEVPMGIWGYIWFFIDMMIYSVLIWYFDNVVAFNRGSGKSIFFCLKKKKMKKRRSLVGDSGLSLVDPLKANLNDSIDSSGSGSIRKDLSKVLSLSNLSKEYKRSIFTSILNIKKDKLKALDSVDIEVDQDELVTILGPNGAGKTTLMSILVGLLSDYQGNVTINGQDISSNRKVIYQNIGYCPQHDVLWDELTAREHLRLYAKVRKVLNDQIDSTISKILEDVKLNDVGDNRVSAMSGGMKRRLSIAIALLGNPKILLLDEPTTGLDPKNRREIWSVIKKMRQGRVLIMTTHAMDEAEALSDRIVVLAKGKVKYDGTPLAFKNRFGDGYRITISLKGKQDDGQMLLKELQSKVPSIEFVRQNASQVEYVIPFDHQNELKGWFMITEGKDKDEIARGIMEKIEDWSISQTKLEEAFLKIINE